MKLMEYIIRRRQDIDNVDTKHYEKNKHQVDVERQGLEQGEHMIREYVININGFKTTSQSKFSLKSNDWVHLSKSM